MGFQVTAGLHCNHAAQCLLIRRVYVVTTSPPAKLTPRHWIKLIFVGSSIIYTIHQVCVLLVTLHTFTTSLVKMIIMIHRKHMKKLSNFLSIFIMLHRAEKGSVLQGLSNSFIGALFGDLQAFLILKMFILWLHILLTTLDGCALGCYNVPNVLHVWGFYCLFACLGKSQKSVSRCPTTCVRMRMCDSRFYE